MTKTIETPYALNYQVYDAGAETSTNNYADNTRYIPFGNYSKALIQITEGNINSITYRIDGSNEQVNWIELQADTVLDNDSIYHTISDAWLMLRVQFKSTVAATHSTSVRTAYVLK